VALVELSGLMIFYPVALPLAYEGLGPWAPLAGWWATQLLTLVLVFWTSGYRPRLCWERARVRAMVRYGVGFSASEWIWSLGKLVNPLIVGRYAGAEAVGQVALATRLVEQLSYVVLLPVARLAIPVFARLREDRGRLTKALNEGTALQLLVIGPVLVGFGLVAPWIVPLLLGSQWLPALEVYPFIAAAYLSGATVSLHSSVLFTLGKLWQIAVTRIAHVVLFAGSALVLVPRLGLKGYGWADMVALPSYVLLLIWVWAYVGKPISAETLVWLACWILALFAWQLGPWAWAILLVPLIWPSTRREVPRAAATVLASISKR
jgi:PST family polysaccharide transporter